MLVFFISKWMLATAEAKYLEKRYKISKAENKVQKHKMAKRLSIFKDKFTEAKKKLTFNINDEILSPMKKPQKKDTMK